MDEPVDPPLPAQPAGLTWPPAVRHRTPPRPWRRAGEAHGPAGDAAAPERRARAPWRWSIRSRRVAAGIGIAAAMLALWPMAQWSWPMVVAWAIGLAVLVLLRLLRLDRLFRGWMWHVFGLVVLAGLVQSVGPWTGALALSIGVLVAGAVRLPAWGPVAAVGAVLCAVTGTGFAISGYRTAEQVAAQQAQTQLENRGRLGAPRPTAVLPALLTMIGRGEAGPVCDTLLAPPARAAFTAAVGRPDCPAAVQALAAQVSDRSAWAAGQAPGTDRGDVREVDACHMTWRRAAAPGPQLGHLTVGRTESGQTWVVTAFRPC